MTTSDLPNAILKISIALAKHHIKNVIGDEALEVVAPTMADVGGEKVRAKVDAIFASKEGRAELIKAAKAADERFRETCQDNDLRQLFAMDYGDLRRCKKPLPACPKPWMMKLYEKPCLQGFEMTRQRASTMRKSTKVSVAEKRSPRVT